MNLIEPVIVETKGWVTELMLHRNLLKSLPLLDVKLITFCSEVITLLLSFCNLKDIVPICMQFHKRFEAEAKLIYRDELIKQENHVFNTKYPLLQAIILSKII